MRPWMALAAGCARVHEGVQVGGEGDPTDPCGERERETVALDASIGDTTPAAIVAAFADPVTVPARWYDGRDVAVTVSAAPTGSPATLRRSSRCPAELSVPATVSVRSADGAVDERLGAMLDLVEPWDVAAYDGSAALDGWRGSLDAAAVDASAGEVRFEGTLGAHPAGWLALGATEVCSWGHEGAER